MKKLFLAVAVLAMAFTACNAIDSNLDKLEEGCKANDKEAVKEALKGLEEAAEDGKEPTKEQEERMKEILKDCPCMLGVALEMGLSN